VRLELGRCGGGEAAAPRGDGGLCGVGTSRVKLTEVGLLPPGADTGLPPHRRGVSSVLALGRRPLASACADNATGASYFLAIAVMVSRSACCRSKRSDCSTRSGCVLASRGLGEGARGLGEGARGRGEAARVVVRDIPNAGRFGARALVWGDTERNTIYLFRRASQGPQGRVVPFGGARQGPDRRLSTAVSSADRAESWPSP
jgi:hypothetical protein